MELVGTTRTQRTDPHTGEPPLPEETATFELSDDQLEHVVGGLVRPVMNPQQLASFLEEAEFSSSS